MKYVSEEISSGLASHEMAYAAVRDALIAASNPDATTFPVVQGHGSDPQNTYAIKSACVADLAGLKVDHIFQPMM